MMTHTEEEIENALNILEKYITEDVGTEECSKCHHEHPNLSWYAYSEPVEIENTIILGWTTCPVTSEPILFFSTHVEEDNDV